MIKVHIFELDEFVSFQLAIVLLFIGKGLTRKSALLRRYSIPEPVIGGFACAAGVSIAYFFFDPKAEGVALRDLGTEGQNVGFNGRSRYLTSQFSLPFGFGFKYSLNKRLGVAVEWGIRKTFTDYVDDVSTTYYLDGEAINPNNVAEIMSDPTMNHKPYEARGNPSTDDWYVFFGATLTYKFKLGRDKSCSDFGNRKDY